MSKVVQCELREYDGNPRMRYGAPERPIRQIRTMVTWLEADKGIEVGDKITLKDLLNGIWWEVMSVSQPHERSDIKRGWGMTDYFGKAEDRK